MPSGFPGGIFYVAPFYVAPFQFSRGVVPALGTLLPGAKSADKRNCLKKSEHLSCPFVDEYQQFRRRI
jgi:hypothetical protein